MSSETAAATSSSSPDPVVSTHEPLAGGVPNEGRTPASEEDGRKVFVGNLGYDVKEEAVQEFFQQGGCQDFQVELVKRFGGRRSSGFAFVTFPSREAANDAVQKMHKKVLGEREITVALRNLSLPGSESRQKRNAARRNVQKPRAAGENGDANEQAQGSAVNETTTANSAEGVKENATEGPKKRQRERKTKRPARRLPGESDDGNEDAAEVTQQPPSTDKASRNRKRRERKARAKAASEEKPTSANDGAAAEKSTGNGELVEAQTDKQAEPTRPKRERKPREPRPRPHDEQQYLRLIRRVIERGQARPDRTGTGTVAVFAPAPLRFSLANGTFPLLTTKKVFTRGIIEELLWFVSGKTDAKILQDKNVHIWDGNGSKEFLEKVGLGHRREGDLGPVYGFQWRHFGAEYKTCDDDYTGKGVDQLAEVIDKIKNNPTDRRIILSAWNPKDLPLMALPPCHMFCQFFVTLPEGADSAKPKLSCLMYQRSCDIGLGIPFNIASYSLLVYMIALMTDTEPHEFILQMGDAHVYKDHIEPLKTQLEREPKAFPTLKLKRSKEEVGSIDGFKLEDFEITGYTPHPAIKMAMSA